MVRVSCYGEFIELLSIFDAIHISQTYLELLSYSCALVILSFGHLLQLKTLRFTALHKHIKPGSAHLAHFNAKSPFYGVLTVYLVAYLYNFLPVEENVQKSFFPYMLIHYLHIIN